MKIAVNLASRPYVDLRPVYTRLQTWIVILALVGGALWYLDRNESGEAQAARAHVALVRNHVQDLQQKQLDYRRLMQQPKDAGILQQSEYLNSLFQRKAFSWTATMTDLETVLPSGVQVLSLDPITGADGNVIIRLRVTGERDRELDLIRNLEKSRHFAQPRLASESLATAQGGPGMQNASTSNLVNFDILADYRPLPLETKPARAADQASGDHPKSTVKQPKTKAPRKPSAQNGRSAQ
jgi:type IV pilus assembly protein PilN